MARPLLPILVILLLGLVISGYAAASLASTPPTVVPHQGTYLEWENTGQYSYVAGLGPNTLFNNSTSLGPGQGSLFIPLVRNLTVHFNDWFNLSASEGIHALFRSVVLLSSPVWNYTLRSPTTLQSNRSSSSSLELENTVALNVTGIVRAVDGFINQTNYAPSSYAVVLDAGLNVSVTSPVGTNTTAFAPSLSLVFASGLIRPGNLTVSTSGTVQVPYTVSVPPSPPSLSRGRGGHRPLRRGLGGGGLLAPPSPGRDEGRRREGTETDHGSLQGGDRRDGHPSQDDQLRGLEELGRLDPRGGHAGSSNSPVPASPAG